MSRGLTESDDESVGLGVWSKDDDDLLGSIERN